MSAVDIIALIERKIISRFAMVKSEDVNLRACLCGVPKYASAQPLDFLASTKNASFSNRKPPEFHPEFPDGHYVVTDSWYAYWELRRLSCKKPLGAH